MRRWPGDDRRIVQESWDSRESDRSKGQKNTEETELSGLGDLRASRGPCFRILLASSNGVRNLERQDGFVKTFFVRVEAKIGPEARIAIESPTRILGYYQRLGVTARDKEELVKLVKDFVEKDFGATVVEIGDFCVPDFDAADADIKDICGNTSRIGIWYHSGHAFFDDDEDGT